MTHLLDSSALFAYLFDEPSSEKVEQLLVDPANEIGLCAISSVEMWARLKSEGRDDAFEAEWEAHAPLFTKIVPVDLRTSLKAIELRRSATGRVPTVDSLIAAAAAIERAVLVHCDPHFLAIPRKMLKQMEIA